MEKGETAQILIRVPADLHKRFRLAMLVEGRSMRDCLQEFIESKAEGYELPKQH